MSSALAASMTGINGTVEFVVASEEYRSEMRVAFDTVSLPWLKRQGFSRDCEQFLRLRLSNQAHNLVQQCLRLVAYLSEVLHRGPVSISIGRPAKVTAAEAARLLQDQVLPGDTATVAELCNLPWLETYFLYRERATGQGYSNSSRRNLSNCALQLCHHLPFSRNRGLLAEQDRELRRLAADVADIAETVAHEPTNQVAATELANAEARLREAEAKVAAAQKLRGVREAGFKLDLEAAQRHNAACRQSVKRDRTSGLLALRKRQRFSPGGHLSYYLAGIGLIMEFLPSPWCSSMLAWHKAARQRAAAGQPVPPPPASSESMANASKSALYLFATCLCVPLRRQNWLGMTIDDARIDTCTASGTITSVRLLLRGPHKTQDHAGPVASSITFPPQAAPLLLVLMSCRQGLLVRNFGSPLGSGRSGDTGQGRAPQELFLGINGQALREGSLNAFLRRLALRTFGPQHWASLNLHQARHTFTGLLSALRLLDDSGTRVALSRAMLTSQSTLSTHYEQLEATHANHSFLRRLTTHPAAAAAGAAAGAAATATADTPAARIARAKRAVMDRFTSGDGAFTLFGLGWLYGGVCCTSAFEYQEDIRCLVELMKALSGAGGRQLAFNDDANSLAPATAPELSGMEFLLQPSWEAVQSVALAIGRRLGAPVRPPEPRVRSIPLTVDALLALTGAESLGGNLGGDAARLLGAAGGGGTTLGGVVSPRAVGPPASSPRQVRHASTAGGDSASAGSSSGAGAQPLGRRLFQHLVYLYTRGGLAPRKLPQRQKVTVFDTVLYCLRTSSVLGMGAAAQLVRLLQEDRRFVLTSASAARLRRACFDMRSDMRRLLGKNQGRAVLLQRLERVEQCATVQELVTLPFVDSKTLPLLVHGRSRLGSTFATMCNSHLTPREAIAELQSVRAACVSSVSAAIPSSTTLSSPATTMTRPMLRSTPTSTTALPPSTTPLAATMSPTCRPSPSSSSSTGPSPASASPTATPMTATSMPAPASTTAAPVSHAPSVAATGACSGWVQSSERVSDMSGWVVEGSGVGDVSGWGVDEVNEVR